MFMVSAVLSCTDFHFLSLTDMIAEINGVFVNYFPRHEQQMPAYSSKRTFHDCRFNDHQLKELRSSYKAGALAFRKVRLLLADKLGLDEPLIHAWYVDLSV